MLDTFHLTLEQYARLTDRQIFELYLHPRKSDGSIDNAIPLLPTPEEKDAEPEPPPTLESEMAQLDALAAALRIPAEKMTELRDKLRAKYGRKT